MTCIFFDWGLAIGRDGHENEKPNQTTHEFKAVMSLPYCCFCPTSAVRNNLVLNKNPNIYIYTRIYIYMCVRAYLYTFFFPIFVNPNFSIWSNVPIWVDFYFCNF